VSRTLLIWPLLLGVAGMAGCARYEARPLDPAQTAARWEQRRLDAPGLRAFLDGQLKGQPNPVETGRWDLNALTLVADYYHPDLAVARAQWLVAAGGVRTAAARPNPSITATPSYDSQIPGNFSPWLIPVTLDVPLETAGKRGKRIAEAEHAAESARWNFVSAAWQVRSHVRDALAAGLWAHRRAELQQLRVSVQGELVHRLEQRLAAGDIARTELVTAQVALNQARLDLGNARAAQEQARADLAEALGVDRQALPEHLIFPDGVPNADALTRPAARSAALRGRADILGALADYAAAEADLDLQVAKQYPDLHLGPGYAWNNGNAGDSQWSLGATLELPILDQNQGPIAEARARRELAAAKFLALQAQIVSQIDHATAGWRAARQQLTTAQELLAQARQQEANVAKQAEAGAADQAEVAAARLETIGVELAQLDARAQCATALGALEDALQQPVDANRTVPVPAPETLKGTMP
jgi:outer membrane protein TolC